MRKIKFRGWSKLYKEWVYGDLVQNPAYVKPMIETYEEDGRYIVEPESVGQYIGFDNCEGDEIFEGDIVIFEQEVTSLPSIYSVGFKDGEFRLFDLKTKDEIGYPLPFTRYRDNLIIHGNMYEDGENYK